MKYIIIGRIKQDWRRISGYILQSGGEITTVAPNKAMVLYNAGKIDKAKIINKVLRVTYTNDRLIPVFNQHNVGKSGNTAVLLSRISDDKGIQGYRILLPSGSQKNLRYSDILKVASRGITLLNAVIQDGEIIETQPEYLDIEDNIAEVERNKKVEVADDREVTPDIIPNSGISERPKKSTSGVGEDKVELKVQIVSVTGFGVVDKSKGENGINKVKHQIVQSSAPQIKSSKGTGISTSHLNNLPRPKFPTSLRDVDIYETSWITDYIPLMTYIKRDKKFIYNLPVFSEFPKIPNDKVLKFFSVAGYPSVVFETVGSLFKSHIRKWGIQIVEPSLIMHIVFDENTPKDLIINPPLDCSQLILGDSLVYEGYTYSSSVTVKSSMVLDSAFSNIPVSIRELTICSNDSGIILDGAFTRLKVDTVKLDVTSYLSLGDRAFYSSTIKHFIGGSPSISDTVTEMEWGTEVFRNCVCLDTFEWCGRLDTLPDKIFYNCIYLQNLLVDDWGTVKVGIDPLGFDDNSNMEVPEDLDIVHRQKVLAYINRCGSLKKCRTLTVSRYSKALEILAVAQRTKMQSNRK